MRLQRIDGGSIIHDHPASEFTADDTNDQITTTNSVDWQTGDDVQLTTTGTLPSPLALSTTYYVIRIDDTTFQLATSQANAESGTQIDITDTGTGTGTETHTIIRNNWSITIKEKYVYVTNYLGDQVESTDTFTAATSSDEITTSSQSWQTGDVVYLTSSGTIPSGLSVDTDYWLIRKSATTYQLASTYWEALAEIPVDITSTGSGTHTIHYTNADPKLCAWIDKWTSKHKLSGRCYSVVSLGYNTDIWKGGVPNVTAIIKGKNNIYDDRTSSTGWTDNAALCAADYLMDSDWGMGVAQSDVNLTQLNTAANECDEQVSVDTSQSQNSFTFTADQNTDIFTLDDKHLWMVGDVVQLTTTGTLPSGLLTSTDYYVIRIDETNIQIASNLANARAGTALNFGSPGSGTLTVTRQSQLRYTANGFVEKDKSHGDILRDLLTSMAGWVVPPGEQWDIHAGAHTSSVMTLDEDDLVGQLNIQTRLERPELFNAVRGVYRGPATQWQPTDLPPITNSTYESEDNGVRLWKDVRLPFTASPHAGERLMKIELERARQQISVTYPAGIRASQLRPGDTVSIDNTRMGWSGKLFFVTDMSPLKVNDDDAGNPVLQVDLLLRETASNVFDWNQEETTVDPAPDSNLPDPFARLTKPSNVTATADSTTYLVTNDGTIIQRILLEWDAVEDARVTRYEVQWKLSTENNWQQDTLGDTAYYIQPLQDDTTYDVRIRSSSAFSNSLWVYVSGGVSVPKLTPTVPDITGLQIDDDISSGTNYGGKDLKVEWTPVSEEAKNFIKDYKIEVLHGATSKRIEYVTSPAYIYTYEKNVEDGSGTPRRDPTIKVWARDVTEQITSTNAATLSADNPAPSLPTNVTLSRLWKTITLSFDPPTDLDYEGIMVWVGSSTGFTRDSSTLIYKGPDRGISFSELANGTQLSPGTTYYIRYAPYDAWIPFSQKDTTSLNESSEQTVTTQNLPPGDIEDGVMDALIDIAGRFTAPNNVNDGDFRVDLGPVSDGGTVYILRLHDNLGTSNFSIDENGNVTTIGTITITGGSGIANLSDASHLAFKRTRNTNNLVENPGAEDNSLDPHYARSQGGTWSVTSSAQRSGGYCFQYDPSGQTANTALDLNGDRTNTTGIHFSASEGDEFYISAWAKRDPGTANNVAIGFAFRNKLGGGTGFSQSSYTSVLSAWEKQEHSATAPTGTAYVTPVLLVQNNGNTPKLYFDDVFVMQKDVAGAAIGSSLVLSSGDLTFQTSGVDTLQVDGTNKRIWINDTTYGNDGIQIEYNSGSPRMHLGNKSGGGPYLEYDGTDLITETLKTSSSGKRIELNPSGDNEIHFYGDRGDSTIEELATIGIRQSGTDYNIAYFGSPDSTRQALRCEGNSHVATILTHNPNGHALLVQNDSTETITRAPILTEAVEFVNAGFQDYGVATIARTTRGLAYKHDDTADVWGYFPYTIVETLSDDTAISFQPLGTTGRSLFVMATTDEDGPTVRHITVLDGSSNNNFHSNNATSSNVALSGTTGDNGKVNISYDGTTFYIENRRGATRTCRVTIFG
jgi:hypothetical protein